MKRYILYFISFLLVFNACQEGPESFNGSDSYPKINSDHPLVKSISADEAKLQAMAFLCDMKNLTRSAEFDKQVSSVYAWRSMEIYNGEVTRSATQSSLPDTLLYIVNFGSDNGYALVSASPKIPGVVAYVEDGCLLPVDEIDNPGFKLFLDGYKEFYEKIDTITSLHQKLVPHLFQLEYCAGPLLTTNWGQAAPYNNDCFTSNGEQAVAGCVAVAIGQIAAYHRYPLYAVTNGLPFEWDSFMCYEQVPVYDLDASNHVALLLHDIGLLVDMNYGVNSSGADFNNVEYVWDCYDYHSQKEYSVDFDSIMVDINNGRPVYMRGAREYILNGEVKRSGHAWVVDGVAIKSVNISCFNPSGELAGTEKIYQKLVHCNWGWNGRNNGYFIIGAFENSYNLSDDTSLAGFRPYNIKNYVYRNIYPYSSSE